MELWQSLVLGAVQGATEFIPVSSSGHLQILQWVLNLQGDNFHLFLEFVNLGTLLALLFYFRKRIWRILNDIFKHQNYRLAINILITSIPAGLIGLILSDFIENSSVINSIITCCVAMTVVGILMIIIEKLPHLKSLKSEEELTPLRALGIGLCQVFALIPGTSRSGTTIIGGRLMGLNSESSAEYSFLASIPIMVAVCGKMFLSSSSRAYFGENIGILLLSNLVAFVVGVIALTFVLKFLKKPGSLEKFGVYRVIVALIVLGTALITSVIFKI